MEKTNTKASATSFKTASTNYSSDCNTPVKVVEKKFPIFNNEYEIIKNIGDGSTAKVYLMRSLKNTKK